MTAPTEGAIPANEGLPIEPPSEGGPQQSRQSFQVVGIGASTGGLQAARRFLEQLPAKPGFTIVVILHLAPTASSEVAAILQQATRMPVRQVREATPIEIDCVYVIPPTHHLSMNDDMLCLVEARRVRGSRVAIDVFFRALADTHRERAIAIVLSGTGADGSAGLQRIREMGGVTFAQEPADAECDAMPRAAIGTGSVDFVLPVVEMAERVIEVVRNARVIVLPPANGAGAEAAPRDQGGARDLADQALNEVLTLLHQRTGHAFTHYKRATIVRRVERRMQVVRVHDLMQYRDHFVKHGEETAALLQDLLIGVTNFYRDRGAFEAFEREALVSLFTDPRRRGPVRAWVVGCATGEEAYSVAMQLQDLATGADHAVAFQVFATDIDERALRVARAGLFPLSIAADVSALRLRKYFTREDGQYRIGKSVRDAVLFARHNVLHDPPFSQVDVISCRNLLIYLDGKAQAQVLEAFRFSLRAGGSLFLGDSETVDGFAAAFVPLDARHRIYHHPAVTGYQRLPLPLAPLSKVVAAEVAAPVPARRISRNEALHQEALEAVAPASVLIDDGYEILHLSRGAGRFLEYAAGAPSHNLVAVVHGSLRLPLRAALFRAMQNGRSVEVTPIRVTLDSQDVFVRIVVRPFRSRTGDDVLMMIVFDAFEESLRSPEAAREAVTNVVVRLEDELVQQRTLLQDSLERSETSTEELKASNEELQAINEELRSATEELETGKEEVQSMYEELATTNDELKSRIGETGKVNDDLQNLIASTDIATIFVDPALHIKRYTPRAVDFFNLIPTDVGRPLLDIRHKLRYDELADDARRAFDTLQPIEREVTSEQDTRLLVRVLPYRTIADRIEGATLTFVDITRLRSAESRARESERLLQFAAAMSQEFAILTLDEAGHVTTWNRGAERIFGYRPAEIVGRSGSILFTPEDRAAGVPEREILTAKHVGRAEDDRWHLRQDQTRFFLSGVMTPFESGGLKGVVKIARDVTLSRAEQIARDTMLTEERAVRAQFEAANRLKDEFLAVVSHELKHPLNLIHVNAELLTRMPQVQALPPVEKAARVIHRAVASQAKIIDDLLDLSRVRTGKLTLQIGGIDLAATVEAIVNASRSDALAKHITLTWQVDGPIATVAADPVRIEQIAWNLLSNAIKFTPDGGHIAVRISADDADACLSVSDDGQGISADFLPHIFEMFGQENNRFNRHHGGLGIGLALVHELVVAQGGRVAAYSPGLGRGARFEVCLPLERALADGGAALDGRARHGLAGLRILVVEDTVDALEAFVELLRIEGAQPFAATDGREALALLDQHPFDLVISDIAMEDIGGYAFVGALRRHPRGSRVPAIALTGFGRPKDKQQAISAGFDAHVTKPASIRDFERVVEALQVTRSSPPDDGSGY